MSTYIYMYVYVDDCHRSVVASRFLFPQPSNTVAAYVKRIFREDKSGEVTLEVGCTLFVLS